jgi:glycogen phosphorylase
MRSATPGDADIGLAVDDLASRLPEPLLPLARIAFDLAWTWAPDGAATFAAVDPERWERAGGNAVGVLRDAPRARLAAAAADRHLVERIVELDEYLRAERERPFDTTLGSPDRPVAFFSAEFGVHQSLPIYSGGLGVLAGDILKESSDLALPMVAVGLLYRTGYFHQRIDTSGYQHEYWLSNDPDRLPCVPVTDDTGSLLRIDVPVLGGLRVQVWRTDVGRVPLYLLDSDVDSNSTTGRWVTSRLYEANRSIRLAQYAVLGIGGARALDALGIRPSVLHINEGHPALAAIELVRRELAAGATEEEAWESARARIVFTTHTPVEAGNETYDENELMSMLGDVAALAGDSSRLVSLGRVHPDDNEGRPGLTPFALRVSRSANGVSRRHGEVAREMWRPIFGNRPAEEVPIGHVTNGVHVPTWMSAPMRALLDRHLGPDWWRRPDREETWEPVADIPAEELWAVRCELRRSTVASMVGRTFADRLRRGEALSYVEAPQHGFDPDRLTVGFARRVATYKRLHLLGLIPERSLALLGGDRPVQFLFAGKAHPSDDAGKRLVQQLFELKNDEVVAGRVAFLEDYDLSFAATLVAGCDVWVNLPRPPQEASGTSGMKSALNGGLQLSVLDGWWAEAFDDTNGWAIDGSIDADDAAQDLRHAHDLMDRMEADVVPTFHDRDAGGVPREWVGMIKRSLMTNGRRFSATRMMREYATRVYPAPGSALGTAGVDDSHE